MVAKRRLPARRPSPSPPSGAAVLWSLPTADRPERIGAGAPAGLVARHRPERIRAGRLAAAPAAGLRIRGMRGRSDDAALAAAQAPPRADLLVMTGEQHLRDLPAAVVGRARVVRVLGIAAQRGA